MQSIKDAARNTAETLHAAFPQWKSPAALVQLDYGFTPQGFFDEQLGICEVDSLPDTGCPASPEPLTFSLGRCEDRQVLVLQNTGPRYRGFGAQTRVLPVCAAKLCGVRNVVNLTAAASLRQDFRPGTWVAVTDYINNTGLPPLAIRDFELFDKAEFTMTHAFSQELIADIINAAAAEGITVRMGIYQANPGPQLATPAEGAAARKNGAELLGTGIIPETVAAHTLGCRTASIALVTHYSDSYHRKPAGMSEILEEIRHWSPSIMRTMRRFIVESTSAVV